MAYTKLIPRHTPGAKVEELSRGEVYRLSIPAGPATQYRLAQLDDYTKIGRGQFPLRPPVRLRLSARTSSESIPGTWGFGLWNDPFGLSLGFGGNPWRLPTLPNAAWFFGASQESYLSFKEHRAPEEHQDYSERRSKTKVEAPATNGPSTSLHSAQGGAANGFLVQVFRSPRFHLSLIPAGLVFPFSRRMTRRILGKIIEEDGVDLSSRRSLTPTNAIERASYTGIDIMQPHRYKLDWREKQVSFEVDDVQVFESPVSPHPPLGLVIWIDNQYAAFTPEGKFGFGVLENPEPAWLEIKDIDMS